MRKCIDRAGWSRALCLLILTRPLLAPDRDSPSARCTSRTYSIHGHSSNRVLKLPYTSTVILRPAFSCLGPPTTRLVPAQYRRVNFFLSILKMQNCLPPTLVDYEPPLISSKISPNTPQVMKCSGYVPTPTRSLIPRQQLTVSIGSSTAR